VVGVTNAIARDMGYELELEAAVKSMKAMLKRGIRGLPGGDYGFAWAPHGENAKDLEYFVQYLGMTPMRPSSRRRAGAADHDAQGPRRASARAGSPTCCCRRRDPLANISILQDKSKLPQS